ncbi:MAG: bifunctional demethylmenaquinone methyltransferase/2-methoxy-6-polyprenyl-1,4-benzoquinol methylase UbiE [Duncaniella sp.]|uniref:bifunctional demethylmenaquinone methyltransferase/2-methoxy-6-polyprenyl-1,4-benzoquinol methylase UbiE n=1 Tax=Duncaniella sp. TaxID=2518496 RepID=UPI0023D1CDEF|nr:bifunctional demethylmenaquinone methyltransferase/2-methoxy-6-polyprenyl-1,4-benzoquinol methylase UbiE [Duncaniella sp.]MDE6090608.1 bifunctional demethylmenaquinone methyltransferase/2-methoxy-6-polyprenyl-1,4-benzoquinol methylase UbiE [Duncaniella sp.]
MQVEKITPYTDDSRHKSEQVREMFDAIAPAYDFMNRAMTFGIDRLWRRKAVRLMRDIPHAEVLDIATGTGDLAILMAERLGGSHITGVDLSEGMVEIGCRKVADRGLSDRVTLTTGDCLCLPFADNSFDCITCAYGVRNFEDLAAGYREMQRVLRPGGLLVVLELSTPPSALVRPFYDIYTRYLIPTVGRMVSKDTRAYSYLPESIAAVPQRENMCEVMRGAGLTGCSYIPLTFGTCTIYTATKPN